MAERQRSSDPVFQVFLSAELMDSAESQHRPSTHPTSDTSPQSASLFQECVNRYSGREEDSPGDGFLSVFDSSSNAIQCALAFQQGLTKFESPQPPKARIGIHMFEELEADRDQVSRKELSEQARNITVRIMDLAEGGQILLTRAPFNHAREQLSSAPDGSPLEWLAHGAYLFPGIEEPVEVCEVGIWGPSVLERPEDSEKAQRAVPLQDELTLGWRPGAGLPVPGGGGWRLEKKLGEGGFGEIWVARHEETQQRRAFKFCFNAERLRALKREITLFRLMKEVLGERNDITRLYDARLEEAPYYLELEYTEGGDLKIWAASKGGLENIPLETRLKLVIQIADALAAANSIGILHKDIKPTNVLIEEKEDGSIQPKLTDFGIGALIERERLGELGIGSSGFTTHATTLQTQYSHHSGTHLYFAPELLAGKEPSIQSDVFALGVLFYQMVVGNLELPLGHGWQRQVENPLICDDIASCVDVDSQQRFTSAGQLAESLRSLEERREALQKLKEQERTTARRRKRRKLLITAVGLLLLVVLSLGYGLRREQIQRAAAVAAQRRAEQEFYYTSIVLAAKSIEEGQLSYASNLLANCPEWARAWEWGRLQYLCNTDLMALRGHTDLVITADFNPNGTLLATGSVDGTVKLWNLETGNLIRTIAHHRVSQVAFSPDGRLLATAGAADNTVKVWDVESGQLIFTLEGHLERVHSVKFSPDGTQIATGSSDDTAKLWDVNKGLEVMTFEGHKNDVLSVDFALNGACLVTTGADATARVWTTKSGQETRVLEDETNSMYPTIAIGPNGRLLAWASWEAPVTLWDLESGDKIATFISTDPEGGIAHLDFSPDGKCIATSLMSGVLEIWDIETGSMIFTLETGVRVNNFVRFSPDGETIATGHDDYSVRIWHVQEQEKGHRLIETGPLIHYEPIALSPDGELLLTLKTDYGCLWDSVSGMLIRRLYGHKDYINAGEFGPDGRLLATGSNDATVKIWNVETGNQTMTLESTDGVRTIVYNGAGSYLAATTLDKNSNENVEIWDTETGKKLQALTGARSNYDDSYGVGLSPDGSRIAMRTGNKTAYKSWISLIDFASGKEVHTLRGHTEPVVAIAFSPDGTQLASGSRDKTARVWSVADGRVLQILRGHTRPIYFLDFTPDGKRLATASQDGTVKIWDVDSGREVLDFGQCTGGSGGSMSWGTVTFSSNGDVLATAGDEIGDVKIWPAFPWKEEDYPGDASIPLVERIELYKREYWKKYYTDEHKVIQEARNLVLSILDKHEYPFQVIDEIQENEDLDENVRGKAIEIINAWQNLGELNQKVWALVDGENSNEENPQIALRLAEFICQAVPDNPIYLNSLATAHSRNGQLEQAEQIWGKAIAEDPTAAYVYADRAVYLYAEMEDWERATRDVYKAVELNPEEHPCLSNVGYRLIAKGEYETAQPILEKCLEIREQLIPDNWQRYDAMSMLGASLAGQGKYAEAEPLLLEGFTKMEGDPEDLLVLKKEPLERLVKLYEDWNKPEEAARWREELAAMQ